MNMGVDEPRENRRVRILGYLPGFVELNVPGLDADDPSPIENYGRWSLAELFAGEQPRASDGYHQLVILRGPSPVKADSGLMRGMTKAARWSSPLGAARWKMVTQTYLISEDDRNFPSWLRRGGQALATLPAAARRTR
jgi:hypothetical protein